MKMKTADFLVLNANRYPDKTALVYRGRRFTYREINERVNRLAHHLTALGIKKGDPVGFMFLNSNQFVEIFFATQKIGALAVPLNFRMVPREVKWVLDNARCKLFAYHEIFSQQVDPVRDDLPAVENLVCSGEDAPPGAHHFESLTEEGSTEEPGVSVGFEDRAFIIYTGGTTGTPKGVVHTHRSSILTCVSGMISLNVSGASEVMLNQVPMFHITGLHTMMQIVASGGRCVIVETFDPTEMLGLIQQENATFLCLVPPSTYIRLMDAPDLNTFDTSTVRKLLTAAGSFPKPIALRLYDTFPNAQVFYGWGQTETGGLGTLHAIPRSMIEEESERARSVGMEMPFMEVRLVDHQGRDVPTGEVGEAIMRSPTIMEEYFEQREVTEQTLQDGWVYSGDLLKKDEEGYFYFVDRKKDMIKSGGENVFAQEVEWAILSHPAVEYCAVFGVPDPKLDEAVMAVVQLRKGLTSTEEEIVQHCKELLSSYKKPRRVAFVDALPMTAAGKIQKHKLREQYSRP
jgi:acyl-CoA synthetase (AMP-forming)/AMP-acid ligase II